MQMYLISDNVDTYTGMKLAGVDGVVVHKENEIVNVLNELNSRKDIGIILVTEKLALQFPHLFQKIREDNLVPLLVEIPDRHGRQKEIDFISEYVNSTIM